MNEIYIKIEQSEGVINERERQIVIKHENLRQATEKDINEGESKIPKVINALNIYKGTWRWIAGYMKRQDE